MVSLKHKRGVFFVVLLTAIILSGCGSNTTDKKSSSTEASDKNGSNTIVSQAELTITDNKEIVIGGKVINSGEIAGATIFLDLNKNSKLDSNEPKTESKADGSYILSLDKNHTAEFNYLNQTAPLVAFGGKDIRTDKAFEDYLMSMTEGKSEVVITPMSTLIAQSVQDDTIKSSQKIFQKSIEETIADIQSKIDAIKKSLAELFEIKENLLTKNPIALAKEGDSSLLSASLQLNKTAQEIKKAMKKEVRELSGAILLSYNVLGKELNKIKKDATQSGDNVLIQALETTMDNSEIFNIDLVAEVKKEAKDIIAQINEFWRDRVLSDDKSLTDALIQSDGEDNPDLGTSTSSSSGTTSGTSSSSSSSSNSGSASASTPDITPPATPALTTTPKFTNQESIKIEVNGEVDSTLLVNGVSSGVLSSGKLILSLDTSGDDGAKDFNLTLKDSSNNYSDELNVSITKDTVPPIQNSTIDDLNTDDATPPLSGNLPSGEEEGNTSNYAVKLKIEDNTYSATNNGDGTWSISDNTIDSLSMGYHDVNITVTDEANNSSSTVIKNKIEIDNTGFLIDSAVEGIKYVSGAFSGYTDKDGLFKYDKGAGVTFYIGDESTGISLGMATEKVDPYNPNRRVITLFDLAGTTDESNPKVVNMGKFLQSLDADGDISNGITIDDRTKESIALLGLKNQIDFNQDIESFHNNSDIYNLMNDLAGHFGEHRGLLPTEDVKAHLVAVRDNKLATLNLSLEKVSGEKEEIKILDGVFQSTTGVVEGLEYRSGNQFGRTDATGAFKYEEGKKVKFSIYQLELGTTEAKATVTPADLVPATSFNHPRPRNIIRLLNAFDAISGDSKITIDNAVREALEKYRSQIDINLPDGKANAELGITAGEDEFGAQFEDFEMGKEILDEIDRLRG